MTAHDAAHESNTDDTDEGVDADTTSAEAKADVDADAEAEAEAVAEAVAEAKADAEHDADADAGLEADDVVDEGDAVDDGVGHGVSAASDGDVLADDAAEFGSDFYDEFDESELDGPSNMGAPPVMEALDAAGVPYEVVGLGGLLLTPEILDLVSALRAIADPSRGDALMRLLTGPMCRLGAADLDGLHEWARFRQKVVKAESQGRLAIDLDPGHRDEDDGVEGPGDALVDLAPEVLDEPSIIEALDDLPPEVWRGTEGQYVGAGALVRLKGLSTALRRLRRLGALPLSDLVGEAERALGLDVEVLSRPG